VTGESTEIVSNYTSR